MKKRLGVYLFTFLLCSCASGNSDLNATYNFVKYEKVEELSAKVENRINNFTLKSLQIDLQNRNTNYVYSPLNQYLVYSLLTASNEDPSLINGLGYSDYKSLEEDNRNLFKSAYQNDEDTKFIMNNAVAIVNTSKYNQERLDYIRENFNASSLIGESEEVTEQLNNWIEEVTNSELSFKVDPLNPGANFVSSIFYEDRWLGERKIVWQDFQTPTETRLESFVETEQKIKYKKTQNVEIGVVNFKNSEVIFIMPNDYSAFNPQNINEELLSNLEEVTTTVRIPNIDFAVDQDFGELNKALGFKDMKDYRSNLLDDSPLGFFDPRGQTRLIISAGGIKVVSVMVILKGSPGPVKSESEGFILSRPFYTIVKYQGLYAFAGVYTGI